MDINSLRVFNSLYKLGLTEKEFESIANEVSHIERTGYSIKAVKGDKVIGIDHDNKHKIIISNKNNEDRIKPKPNTRILLKTLITFDEIPQEIYTLHTILRYRALDLTIKHTANDLEELKLRVLERLGDNYPKTLADQIYGDEYCGYDEEKRKKAKLKKEELVQNQLRAIFWLFDEECKLEVKEIRVNMPTIIKVFEKNNMRLALIQENEKFLKTHSFFNRDYNTEICEGIKFRIMSYKPSDNRYNYVDVGREIYLGRYSNDKEVWVCDDELLGKIPISELEIIFSRLDRGYGLLTKDEYALIKDSLRVEMLSARREELEEQAKTKLTEKLEKQFSQGKVCRGGVEYTLSSITYNDITLRGDKIGDYITSANLIYRESSDINNTLAGYIDFILKRSVDYTHYNNERSVYDLKESVNFSINEVKVNVKKRDKNFYVNNLYRVRIDEVTRVLLMSLNFKTTKDYNLFLEGVSKESLRVQNALENGIVFKLIIGKDESNSLITEKKCGQFDLFIPLKKKDKKIYVQIFDKDFRVKDITSLFELERDICDLTRTNPLERTIKLLYKSIEGITPKEIGGLIEKALQENKNKIKRSKEFIANAVAMTKAKIEVMEIENKKQEGYIIIGKSGQEYFVGNDLRVWRMKDSKVVGYICIVDYVGVRGEAQHNDFIAKRLLALHNDIDVANEITTLGLKGREE